MLKELYQIDCLNIEKLLLTKYNELNLNEKEVIVLNLLFAQSKASQTVDLAHITKKSNFSLSEVSSIVDSLIQKGLITLEIAIIRNREKEIINIDQTFKKLEEIFDNQKQANKAEVIKNDISFIVETLEKEFGRNLSPIELNVVKEWFSLDVSKQMILDSITEAVKCNKFNLKYIDSVLVNKIKNGNNVIQYEQDEKFKQQLFDLINTFKK